MPKSTHLKSSIVNKSISSHKNNRSWWDTLDDDEEDSTSISTPKSNKVQGKSMMKSSNKTVEYHRGSNCSNPEDNETSPQTTSHVNIMHSDDVEDDDFDSRGKRTQRNKSNLSDTAIFPTWGYRELNRTTKNSTNNDNSKSESSNRHSYNSDEAAVDDDGNDKSDELFDRSEMEKMRLANPLINPDVLLYNMANNGLLDKHDQDLLFNRAPSFADLPPNDKNGKCAVNCSNHSQKQQQQQQQSSKTKQIGLFDIPAFVEPSNSHGNVSRINHKPQQHRQCNYQNNNTQDTSQFHNHYGHWREPSCTRTVHKNEGYPQQYQLPRDVNNKSDDPFQSIMTELNAPLSPPPSPPNNGFYYDFGHPSMTKSNQGYYEKKGKQHTDNRGDYDCCNDCNEDSEHTLKPPRSCHRGKNKHRQKSSDDWINSTYGKSFDPPGYNSPNSMVNRPPIPYHQHPDQQPQPYMHTIPQHQYPDQQPQPYMHTFPQHHHPDQQPQPYMHMPQENHQQHQMVFFPVNMEQPTSYGDNSMMYNNYNGYPRYQNNGGCSSHGYKEMYDPLGYREWPDSRVFQIP